ncbi:MAG: hypothetical protein BWZ03_00399 [bacterium ADurb.BinA186]|nr:MAG: hypothetical protein BWZ03_00399 [bacterium ADurb.BinA186]
MKFVNVMLMLAAFITGMTINGSILRAEVTKAEKSTQKTETRKKKVEMCGTCGKPEKNLNVITAKS